MTVPLFLVDAAALVADQVVIDGAEGHHAADVRRVVAGEAVDVGDGDGALAHGVVTEVARGRVVVEVRARVEVPEPALRFVVVQALAKGGRDTDAVEAMTEVGVDEVLAWPAQRSVVRWSDRVGARWSAAARAAAKQAHRVRVPRVSGPVSTADVSARLQAADLAVVLHEVADAPLARLDLPETGTVVIVVGPEGGLTDEEVAGFRTDGARVCRLGETVLRTSTAGVAALSVLSAGTRWR